MTSKTKRSNRRGGGDGDTLKGEALALLEARREIYVRRGRRSLLVAMLDGDGRATADDARIELPAGIDPRCLGSVPGRLAAEGIIWAAGFVRSARPERHSSYIQAWALLDRDAAEQWLWEHPDLPDPADADLGDKQQGVLFPAQEIATPAAGTVGAELK